ncbi:hypothetical protein [Streptomyces sp. NRRL S-1521]|uniref:hypothetical protein n=1 Tax=Streptomyces sp. NRRL S-1521 TaxID=1609100 RepID=UPI000749ABCC|nr:hypothetical protein [Streptomyces sp. NRRL S-1521]KUL53165.1 hypothetical protein ADL30_20675 [Streptomyces sp. NRRL S-1521]
MLGVAQELGQGLGDGGDGFQGRLSAEDGLVGLVMSDLAPVPLREHWVEVDEVTAVGAVDLDAPGGGVVPVLSAEKVDGGTDDVGDPVPGPGYVRR